MTGTARRGVTRTSPAERRSSNLQRRNLLVLVLIGLVTIAVVLAALLPASVITRFLPPEVKAADFSGSVWHGSAGRLRILGREAGALEWRLHPAALLHLGLDAELHWVQAGFVLDGRVQSSGHDLTLSNVEGGGPVEDLQGLGVPAGLRGIATIHAERLQANLAAPEPVAKSLVGTLQLADTSLASVAGGADLGGYAFDLANPTVAPGAELVGHLHDTGGPLALDAEVRYAPTTHIATLSGTVAPRGDVPPALQRELTALSQLHAPDASGRIPVDLEFRL